MTKRALLKFEISVDSDAADPYRNREVFAPVYLYREDGTLVWRIGGPLGDLVETLPTPSSLAQAKADARAVFPVNSAWKTRAKWI